MAITQVGNWQSISTNNGGGGSITFGTAPIADDLIVIVGGCGTVTAGSGYGPSTAGYTQQAGSNANASLSFGVWTKKSAGSDTSVAFNGTGLAADSSAYLSVILRGVDPTTPLDSTPAYIVLADPPGITINTVGAYVIACGATSNNVAPTVAPTNYTMGTTRTGLDTNKIGIGAAYRIMAATGTEDPGAFTWVTTSPNRGITIAFMPAGAGGGGGPVPFEGWGIPI